MQLQHKLKHRHTLIDMKQLTLDGSYGESLEGISKIVGIGSVWALITCLTTSAIDWAINTIAMSLRVRNDLKK